ncbi:MAG TPA: glycoside hydrolase family 43 protein [Flavisolibacter sp.]|jgi:beta-xylosidase|nr:glycoside hydrolase family 43 protein [Flavisolibacter sp.]
MTKATLFLLALLTGGSTLFAQNTGNPVIQGWYADPEAAVFNNRFWIYPTYSDKYEKQVFMDAFSSTDLKTWVKHPHIIDTAAVKWAQKAMWAPAIIQKDSLYYLFFSANDVHPGEVGGIGVAVSSKPDGPFRDLLGKPLIPEVHNGAQPIDQFVYKDKDGQYYMIYGGWGHCNMVRLKDDFTGLLPHADGTVYKEITPQGYVEGPMVFTRNNKYYFMWSEGGWTGPDYRVAYAMADSMTGTLQRIGTVLQQDPLVATGAGHHSIVNVPGTDDWYIIYHRRPLGETDGNHRVVCIDKLVFDKKGRIQPVRITKEGVPPVSVKW